MTLSARLNAHADRYMVPTAKDYKRWATEAAALENMVLGHHVSEAAALSLWSVVRCNSCGITSEAAETDSDADDKARKAGWVVAWQRTPVARAEAEDPTSTLHAAATAKALDFCATCRDAPRQP